MTTCSNRQQQYLNLQKRHHFLIHFFRILILVVFLILWEWTSQSGMIDSFVFGSPSKIARCFWNMVLDKTIFFHLGITLYETLLSFLFVTGISILSALLLWYSKKLSKILEPYLVVLNSLPKSALAPLLIVWLGANQTTIIIAGISVADLWKHPKSIHQFHQCRPGKDQTDLYTARNQVPCLDQSRPSGKRACDHQQHESQYRIVSGGRHHR